MKFFSKFKRCANSSNSNKCCIAQTSNTAFIGLLIACRKNDLGVLFKIISFPVDLELENTLINYYSIFNLTIVEIILGNDINREAQWLL